VRRKTLLSTTPSFRLPRAATIVVMLVIIAISAPAHAQVRLKSQDRGSYRPPTVPAAERSDTPSGREAFTSGGPALVEQVGYDAALQPLGLPSPYEPAMESLAPYHPADIGCDMQGCDGCGSCAPRHDWFASAELMLWWRRPQSLPALVTTSDPGTAFESAGELGQASTSVLFGNDRYGDSVSTGGRFTLGKWLDAGHYQSLTGRFWLTGSEDFGFHTNSTSNPIIARPFLDFTTNPAGEANAVVVAFPNRRDASLTVEGTSEVYGADVSLQQLIRQGLGGRLDFMYGYQFLRINEDLHIRSDTLFTGAGDTSPVGTLRILRDQFDVENEFHGGHFGFSGYYEEGCWTLDGLIKFGFGSLTRRGTASGSTETIINGTSGFDPGGGLLVRNSNAGAFSDSTFAWVPELNVNLGYHWRPGVDLSIGYSVLGLTDALQPWRAIDPNLASDLSDTPTRPAPELSYGDYWVQAIQFGIRWYY